MEDNFVREVCKLGTSQCCRYLICGAEGFICAKLTLMKTILDIRVANGEMNAVGDNCEGEEGE